MPFALPAHRPLIMGIINATPDSFSGDGLMSAEDAVTQAVQMLEEGADILDIGGESSRPGAAPVSAQEEIGRTVPVIAAIKKRAPTAVISIDTTKAVVAEAALDAGAVIINDISALADPAMGALAARGGCPIILMHNRSNPQAVAQDARIGGTYLAANHGDIVETVCRELGESAVAARHAGIAADKVILDPGLGFGKTVEQNLSLIHRLGRLKELGYPVLAGPSRKSFIGLALNLPVEERLEGTTALVALAAFNGADIIRVHDVKFMVRVAKMAALTAKS